MMPAVAATIEAAARRLAAVSETPRLDAELILAHALDISRASLLARIREDVPTPGRFEPMLRRRERGEPLAYLFGRWEFFSLDFEIEPPVLVPRPETEHLVETVIGFIGDTPARVLDVCTGSGCVAVSIAANAPHARVVATDIEPRYVRLAERNAARHGVESRVECRVGDLFDAVKHPETFDVICANPPYVEADAWNELSPTIREFEDPRALLAGDDGLDVLATIARCAPAYLRPGGLLAVEIGLGQREAAAKLFGDAGMADVGLVRDLAGIDRVIHGISGDPGHTAKDYARSERLSSRGTARASVDNRDPGSPLP